MNDESYRIIDKTKKSNLNKKMRRRKQKYFSILNEVILDIIIKRKLTFDTFSEILFTTLDLLNLYNNKSAYRNQLISHILGYLKLSYNQFEFIMVEVFKEPIPDDPEIEHLKNLGNCVDIRDNLPIDNYWTVLKCIGRDKWDSVLWLCKCKCGVEKIVSGPSLISGASKSCGCYQKEVVSILKTKHGMAYSREFRTWQDMKDRCYNVNNVRYCDYGGRGIIVCDRWRNSFENFYADMGDRPEGNSIERCDNDGNYEPGNCCWATRTEQNNNQRIRSDALIFSDGMLVSLFAKENNLNYSKVVYYFHAGCSQTEILEKLS